MGWIRRLGKRIGYVHLHDNNGERDEHLAFGEGTIPLADVCRALEEEAPDAVWTVELAGGIPDLQKSMEWLVEHGFRRA